MNSRREVPGENSSKYSLRNEEFYCIMQKRSDRRRNSKLALLTSGRAVLVGSSKRELPSAYEVGRL